MESPDAQTALITQLQAPGVKSKKYTMVIIGLGCVLFVFVFSLITLIMKPELASPVASIAPVALASIGGLVAVYAGSQAAVDWNTTSSLAKKTG